MIITRISLDYSGQSYIRILKYAKNILLGSMSVSFPSRPHIGQEQWYTFPKKAEAYISSSHLSAVQELPTLKSRNKSN